MQNKKEEVKNRVMVAATKAFSVNGFSKTSVMQISHESKVPIGNLYRYFPSKDVLFEEIVGSTYAECFNLIGKSYLETLDMAENTALEKFENQTRRIVESFLAFLHGNTTQFLILLDKSHGSKFEGFKGELISKISEIIGIGILGVKEEENSLIAKSMSTCLLESVISIINTVPKGQQKLQIERLMHFFFYKMEDRLAHPKK